MNRPLTIQEWFESLGKMVEEFDWEGNGMSEQDKAPVEQEPVAWQHRQRGLNATDWQEWHTVGYKPQGPEDDRFQIRPLYTHPKQWAGLTDEEIMKMLDYGQYGRVPQYARNFVDAIEAALKEKNT